MESSTPPAGLRQAPVSAGRQATARSAELLRQRRHGTALVGSVSGVLTKQGFGLWSRQPPRRAFVHEDVSSAVAAAMPTVDVLENYKGHATVAGCTVLHGRDCAPRGVALLDTAAGQRVLATTDEPAHIDAMQTEEWVGRRCEVDGDRFKPSRA